MPDTGHEGRRGPRLLLQIPLSLNGGGRVVRGHTVVVNTFGALVLSPLCFPDEALVKVENATTGASTLCRVAWCGGEELEGLFKLGLEIMGNARGFWGPEFEARIRELSAPAA